MLLPVLVAAAAIGMAVRWRRWTPIVLTAATAAGSLTFTVVGKAVVRRARPPFIDAVPPYGSSAWFPSGHSLNSAALATVVAYLLLRGERSNGTRVLTVALAAAFTLGIGLSRGLSRRALADRRPGGLGARCSAWSTVVIIGHRLFLTLRRSTRANDAAEPNGGARGSEADGPPDEDDVDAENLPDEAVLRVGGQGASVLESQPVPVDPLVGGVQGGTSSCAPTMKMTLAAPHRRQIQTSKKQLRHRFCDVGWRFAHNGVALTGASRLRVDPLTDTADSPSRPPWTPTPVATTHG